MELAADKTRHSITTRTKGEVFGQVQAVRLYSSSRVDLIGFARKCTGEGYGVDALVEEGLAASSGIPCTGKRPSSRALMARDEAFVTTGDAVFRCSCSRAATNPAGSKRQEAGETATKHSELP